MRACAIEMHFNTSQEHTEIRIHVHISQETSEEPLYTQIYRKNAATQIGPRTRTHTLCEPAQSKCMSTFRAQNADTHFVRACAVEMDVHISQEAQKSHFIRKFTGKILRPRLGPERGADVVQACAIEMYVHISH